MARSIKGSSQRPDTLMQDRTSANSMKVLLQRAAGPYIGVTTGSALVELKISASSPKPDICTLMSTRFGRFTQAAARCKSIFDNAGIAAAVVERRVRGWRGVRRAKVGGGGGPVFFFPPVVSRPWGPGGGDAGGRRKRSSS